MRILEPGQQISRVVEDLVPLLKSRVHLVRGIARGVMRRIDPRSAGPCRPTRRAARRGTGDGRGVERGELSTTEATEAGRRGRQAARPPLKPGPPARRYLPTLTPHPGFPPAARAAGE